MKYTVAAAAVAFAGVTAAQEGIPECALPCLTTAVTNLGCTGLDDAACACTPENQAALIGDTEMINCLVNGCTDPADLENATTAGLAACADAGEGGEEGEATATETGDEAEATATATETDDEAEATETGDEAEATETGDEAEATETSDETEATETESADETDATSTAEPTTVPGSGASTNAFFSAAAFFAAVLAF